MPLDERVTSEPPNEIGNFEKDVSKSLDKEKIMQETIKKVSTPTPSPIEKAEKAEVIEIVSQDDSTKAPAQDTKPQP